jgi:hypothetical protein
MRSHTSRAWLFGLAVILAFAAPALAGDRLERTFNLQPGGRLRLETAVGRVRVTGKSGPGAHLLVTTKGQDLDEILTFRFDESPSSVTISARNKHQFWSFHSNSVEFEVEVPAETSVDIETSGGPIEASGLRAPAKLDTSGGSVTVHDLDANLQAHSSGGPIRLRDIRGDCRVSTSGGGIDASHLEGKLNAETSGGPISLDGITGDADVHTSGGGIRIKNAGGRVVAETSGGSIDAEFAKGNSRGGSLESSGGGITVAVDPGVGLSIDAEADHVHSDLPLRVQGEISRRSLRGDLGNGGEKLLLRTSGGGIRIQAL